MHMCMFDAHPHECGDIYSQGQLNLVPVLPAASLFIFSPLPGWRRACVSIDLLPSCWGDTKAAPGEIRLQLGLPLKYTHERTLTPTKGLQFCSADANATWISNQPSSPQTESNRVRNTRPLAAARPLLANCCTLWFSPELLTHSWTKKEKTKQKQN